MYIILKFHVFVPESLGNSAIGWNNFCSFHTFNKCPSSEQRYLGGSINIA